VTCEDDTVTVISNGMPHYEFQAVTPNPLTEQNFEWAFPRYPEVAATSTEIPLLGTAGMAINGIPVYGPNEGDFPDPFGDPIYNDVVDWCMGHTGGNGDYHFHAFLQECFTTAVENGIASPILGYALDGFPIYGPNGCADESCTDVKEFKSSWEVTGDPTTYAWDNHACTKASCDEAVGDYLDACNGRIGPDGTYRYHATAGFPYLLGCYKGTASSSAGDGAPGGGGGPGGATGPAPCETDADCVGACPPGSIDCVCHTNPMGEDICVPFCEKDEDCPDMLTCNESEQVCVPPQP
jgi:hypothetical protein